MIIKRQKEFTSRATKALRKELLFKSGDVQKYTTKGKIFKKKVERKGRELEEELAEAAKKKFGRGSWNRSHGHYPSGKSWKERTDLPDRLSDAYINSDRSVGSPNLMERITDKGILENIGKTDKVRINKLRKDKKTGDTERWLKEHMEAGPDSIIYSGKSLIPFEERKKMEIKEYEGFLKSRDKAIKEHDRGTPWRYPRPER